LSFSSFAGSSFTSSIFSSFFAFFSFFGFAFFAASFTASSSSRFLRSAAAFSSNSAFALARASFAALAFSAAIVLLSFLMTTYTFPVLTSCNFFESAAFLLAALFLCKTPLLTAESSSEKTSDNNFSANSKFKVSIALLNFLMVVLTSEF